MAQKKFSSWEHLFENKRSYQAYNKKLANIKTSYARAVADHNNAWQFMENNHDLNLLSKNVTRVDKFFLFHHCDTVGQSMVDKEK